MNYLDYVTISGDAVISIAASSVLWVLLTDNLLRNYHAWNDVPTGSRFRGFVIGMLLWTAALTFVFGSLSLMWPGFAVLSRSLGFMVRGSFIVVGLFLWISWRRR